MAGFPTNILAEIFFRATVRDRYRRLKRVWRGVFLWPLYAARKSRFQGLGHARGCPLPAATLALADGCACRDVAAFARLTRRDLSEYALQDTPERALRLRPTAAALDLDGFADFNAWRVGVSRATNGKYHRSANRAKRLGYASRFVGLRSYQRSLHELTGSKWRRSKGLLVLEALVGPGHRLTDTGAPAEPAACPRHWRQCWGCFQTTPEGEKLAGFAILIRAGNVVWVQRLIGHGDALADGVMKLMIFDIMQWLLARAEPSTQGVRYLIHGSVEEGGRGLFDWKRYLGFKPMLLRGA